MHPLYNHFHGVGVTDLNNGVVRSDVAGHVAPCTEARDSLLNHHYPALEYLRRNTLF